jgi:PAS domain S-box-containing protein
MTGNPAKTAKGKAPREKGADGTAEHSPRDLADLVRTLQANLAGLEMQNESLRRDITEHKQAEDAVIRARLEWERTFDSVSDLIAILDDGRRIVRINGAMARKLGRTAEECAGLACFEVMHSCGAPPVNCPHALTLQDGMEHTIEMCEERLGGDYSVTTSALKDADGRLLGVVHVARDITDSKRAEREREENAARLAWGQSAADMINAMKEGVALLDMDGTVVSVNPALANLTGLSRQDAVGRNIETILPILLDGDDLAKARRGLRDLRRGEVPEIPPLRLRRAGGREFIVDSSVSLIETPDRARRLVVLTLKDMTDLHVALRRMRTLTGRLAAAEDQTRWRIASYIHDTIVQNLALSKIRLGSLTKPLTDAALTAEIARIQQVRTLLDDAISECRTVMSDLTPALLYEMGLGPALEALARKLEEKYGMPVLFKDNAQEISLPPEHRGMLFESVRELIMNALKHAGPCDIRVTLSCRNGQFIIRVEDNGTGFDAVSGEAHRKSEDGFGLFSIRQRLYGLGGCLDIETTPGLGTKATIRIPMQELS